MLMSAKPTIFIDATALKTSKCMRRLSYIVVDGYTPIGKDFKVEYGSAGHLFIANWYKTRDVKESLMLAMAYYTDPTIEIPANDFRTVVHLSLTLAQYAAHYEHDMFKVLKDKDGKPLIEQRFSIPVYEDDYLRVILFGVLDALGDYGREIVFEDHKFTSAYNPSEYFASYDLSVQMITYKYALTYLANQYPDTFGMFKNAKCLIDGIFINKLGAKFERNSLIDIGEGRLEEYHTLLQGLCVRLSKCVREGKYPRDGMINGACEGEYFKLCPFFHVCSLNDSEYLQLNFTQRSYGPEIFDKP